MLKKEQLGEEQHELEEGKRFSDNSGVLLIKSSPNNLQKMRAKLNQEGDGEYLWSFTKENLINNSQASLVQQAQDSNIKVLKVDSSTKTSLVLDSRHFILNRSLESGKVYEWGQVSGFK